MLKVFICMGPHLPNGRCQIKPCTQPKETDYQNKDGQWLSEATYFRFMDAQMAYVAQKDACRECQQLDQ